MEVSKKVIFAILGALVVLVVVIVVVVVVPKLRGAKGDESSSPPITNTAGPGTITNTAAPGTSSAPTGTEKDYDFRIDGTRDSSRNRGEAENFNILVMLQNGVFDGEYKKFTLDRMSETGFEESELKEFIEGMFALDSDLVSIESEEGKKYVYYDGIQVYLKKGGTVFVRLGDDFRSYAFHADNSGYFVKADMGLNTPVFAKLNGEQWEEVGKLSR